MSDSTAKSWKKKAAVGAVCAAASAGVLVGGVFDNPADLLNDSSAAAVTVQMHCDGDDAGQASDEDKARKSGSLRQWFLQLPVGVRALIGVPLWGVGWCILSALGLLWQGLLTPLGSKILGWLLAAAVSLGVFAVTAKAMFPNLPLKKILSRRNILLVVGGVLLLGAADTILPLVWDKYPPISLALRLGGSAVLILCAVLSVRKLHPHQKDCGKTVVQQAMELADTVCAPLYHE
ncbi:MAG: hypothetical protein KBS74_07755 [Clostridiales bacterium]|nr:hypothetical protein [Candidatus Cacconaster stercorequi]